MMNDILRNNGERLTPTFKEEFQITKSITDAKKKCRCGHTQLVIKKHDSDFVLCTWCSGRLYFDDEKQKIYEHERNRNEFLYRMRKVLDANGKEAIF